MVLSPLNTLKSSHMTRPNHQEIEMLHPHVQYLGPAHPNARSEVVMMTGEPNGRNNDSMHIRPLE